MELRAPKYSYTELFVYGVVRILCYLYYEVFVCWVLSFLFLKNILSCLCNSLLVIWCYLYIGILNFKLECSIAISARSKK